MWIIKGLYFISYNDITYNMHKKIHFMLVKPV